MLTEDFITTNLPAFQQIENELNITFTHDQQVDIAHLTMDGMDFYEAFDQVIPD